jgi:hypothetical protein
MDDKTLLELAAKAAGIRVRVWQDGMQTGFLEADIPHLWNPLTDDGDALRLAVKLRLTIDFNARGVFAGAAHPKPGGFADERGHGESSVRRAIVRAAAALGEKT